MSFLRTHLRDWPLLESSGELENSLIPFISELEAFQSVLISRRCERERDGDVALHECERREKGERERGGGEKEREIENYEAGGRMQDDH